MKKSFLTVSIHALLAESDSSVGWSWGAKWWFQSTPSLRRATGRNIPVGQVHTVSIHALLAESDRAPCRVFRPRAGFNPRPPCGERPHEARLPNDGLQFQSTPSLRRATGRKGRAERRAESFNPRPPCGERPNTPFSSKVPVKVSIHALLAESDCGGNKKKQNQ